MQGFPTSLIETAVALVRHCQEHTEAQGLEELYAPDCVSIEGCSMSPEAPAEIIGIEAIKAKHAWWYANFDVHSSNAEGPFLHGENQFSVIFSMDVTDKNTGIRSHMKEVAVYTESFGKIVREQFFYGLPA
jgi:hypothetical protein